MSQAVAVPRIAAGLVLAASACVGPGELGHLRSPQTGDLTHAEVRRAPFDEALARRCGPGEGTIVGSSRFLRSPYLQKVTDHGAELLFTTASRAPASVVLEMPDGRTRTVTTHAGPSGKHFDATLHVAHLADLQPGAIHCYRVEDDGEIWWTNTGFRTAPRADAEVQFVALGDLGRSTVDQHAVAVQMALVPHEFVLVSGDVAYTRGRPEELEQYFFGVYARALTRVPFFPTTGNHDYRTDDAGPFREAFALFENGGPEGLERWYSFDWGPVHVVVLDTEELGDAQRRWLARDLIANDSPWTIALTHRPPYSSGHKGSQRKTRRELVPLFVEHGVNLVLSGHDHHYERSRPIEDVTYVVTGGGGRGTRAVGRSWFTAFRARVAHFVHVTATPTELRLVAIDATGAAFDSMLLQR